MTTAPEAPPASAPPVSPHQGADPHVGPVRRARFSGEFQAHNLSDEWRGRETLAELAQAAGMTTLEARAVLLYVAYEKSAREVGIVLDVSRPNVWRLLRRAGKRVLQTWPDLDEALRQWSEAYRLEKVSVLECFRNSAPSDRTPLYMQNSPGQYRTVSSPRLVDWRQLIAIDAPLVAVERLPGLSVGAAGKIPATLDGA